MVRGPSHCLILVRKPRVREEAVEGAEVRFLTALKAAGTNSIRIMGKSNPSDSKVEAMKISSPRREK